MKIVGFAILTSAFLISCASGYKAIKPEALVYPSSIEENFTYRINVLSAAGNRKLAKKEVKKNIKIVSVRIKNDTDKRLIYGTSYKLYNGNTELNILEPVQVTKLIKQNGGLHFLYLLLSPMQLNIQSGINRKSFPIGLIVGPALAVTNFSIASNANKKFRNELETYSILNKEILPGQTLYGLLALEEWAIGNIQLKVQE